MIKKLPYLLFIEPKTNGHSPIIDILTEKITALYRTSLSGIMDRAEVWVPDSGYMGGHEDICGCRSTGQNYLVKDEYITNSLCIHYVACHRNEIPDEQLELIFLLTTDRTTPIWKEIFPK